MMFPAKACPILLLLATTMAPLPVLTQVPSPPVYQNELGYKGPVRSVMTTVERLHPDPRPEDQRRLGINTSPGWVEFDNQGRRTAMASAANSNQVTVVSKCSRKQDGTEVWTDSTGHTSEGRRVEKILADGTQDVTYFLNSHIESRELRRMDQRGRTIEYRSYDSKNRLRSEDLYSYAGEDESITSKMFGENGETVLHNVTRTSTDQKRMDRWDYDSNGRLAWHIGLSFDGELLSSWYRTGYIAKVSSSDSLGLCLDKRCISYKFDEHGSGRLEKTVQHLDDQGNRGNDADEHFDSTGALDEKVRFEYVRDSFGNWTSRSVFVWDAKSNEMIEVERDTRKIEYY